MRGEFVGHEIFTEFLEGERKVFVLSISTFSFIDINFVNEVIQLQSQRIHLPLPYSIRLGFMHEAHTTS